MYNLVIFPSPVVMVYARLRSCLVIIYEGHFLHHANYPKLPIIFFAALYIVAQTLKVSETK